MELVVDEASPCLGQFPARIVGAAQPFGGHRCPFGGIAELFVRVIAVLRHAYTADELAVIKLIVDRRTVKTRNICVFKTLPESEEMRDGFKQCLRLCTEGDGQLADSAFRCAVQLHFVFYSGAVFVLQAGFH